MINVTTRNGFITEESPEKVVRLLLKGRLFTSTMREVADRTKIWNGHDIRTDKAESFLRDLAKQGIIEIEWETK